MNEEYSSINVPYIVHESTEARYERIIKRLVIALVICIVLMFATNVFWIYEFCSYDYATEETTVQADSGTANYIGQDGDITYGENNGTQADTQEKT